LNYPGKPGKNSNGLIATTPVATMPASPAVALASPHRPSIGGRNATTPAYSQPVLSIWSCESLLVVRAVERIFRKGRCVTNQMNEYILFPLSGKNGKIKREIN